MPRLHMKQKGHLDFAQASAGVPDGCKGADADVQRRDAGSDASSCTSEGSGPIEPSTGSSQDIISRSQQSCCKQHSDPPDPTRVWKPTSKQLSAESTPFSSQGHPMEARKLGSRTIAHQSAHHSPASSCSAEDSALPAAAAKPALDTDGSKFDDPEVILDTNRPASDQAANASELQDHQQRSALTSAGTMHGTSSDQQDSQALPQSHQQLEGTYVTSMYDAIAPHFSATRFAVWPRVRGFIESLPAGAIVADVGCGNGKYFGVRRDIMVFGSDRSIGLAKVSLATNTLPAVSWEINAQSSDAVRSQIPMIVRGWRGEGAIGLEEETSMQNVFCHEEL